MDPLVDLQDSGGPGLGIRPGPVPERSSVNRKTDFRMGSVGIPLEPVSYQHKGAL